MVQHEKYLLLAKRLIAKHGRPFGFEKIEVQTDPDQPWNGGTSTPVVIEPLMGVMVPFKGNDFGSSWQDWDLSKTADNIVLVAGDQNHLETFHVLLDAGQRYKVEWCQVLQPGATVLLYAFGVNR